jgi:hypothetical protein
MQSRHVLGVHVMEGFAATVGQQAGAVGAQRADHSRVEVAGGADGHPPWAADVTGMHDAGKHPVLLSRQIPLDGQLVDTVFPRSSGRRAGTIGPDAPRVDDMLTIQSIDQLPRLLRL